MDIYLIDPAGPQLRLPVNPSEITIRRERQYETVNIVSIGEVDFATGEKLTEISFSSFFPATYDPSYCRYPELPDPQAAMQQLTIWKASKSPIRLIITETEHNVLVMITSHNTTYKGGEPGDVYFELSMRLWREVKVRTTADLAAPAVTPSGVQQAVSRPDVKPVPKTYAVKPGDSLWVIAKLQFGDGNKWRSIYDANQSIIGPDPNVIKPGQQLVMPA